MRLISQNLILLSLILFSILTNSIAQNTPPKYIKGMAVPSDLYVVTPGDDLSTAGGKIFLGNWTGTPYVMIYETDGTPYFYEKTEDISIDFKVLSNGVLSRNIRGDTGSFVLMDTNYNYIDTIKSKNGYGLDHHDFQITPEGTYLIIPIENKNFDISGLVAGGGTNVQFRGNHIQEIDQDGNLLFEWICWDHFDLTDTEKPLTGVSGVDFTHMNSVGVDFDGHLLISCRSFSECTKINRNTGEIMWRLGGKRNQFTFDEDTIFRIQHDFRAVPGQPNHYTLYDNNVPRCVEYYLDTVAMTAEKVWEYRADERESLSRGNAQRLENGNTLINWVNEPSPRFSEVTPEGDVVFEASYDFDSYRVFRFEWEGVKDEPYLTGEDYSTFIRGIYHKFGDTLVDHYNIYLSTNSSIDYLYESTDSCWFDIELNSLSSNTKHYLKVTAVNIYDEESDFSNQYEFTTGLTSSDNNAIRGKTKEPESTDPEWINSDLGYAFSFDGDDDLVNCGNSLNLQIGNSAFTFEALIFTDTLNGTVSEKNILNKEEELSGYKLYMGDDGCIAFYIADGSTWEGIITADNVVTINEWNHVAAVLDNTEMRIYINGQLTQTGNVSIKMFNSSSPLYIGSSNLNPDNSFDGMIDEVRLWNTARTQEQILEYISDEIDCKDSTLFGYWKLNEGSGQVTVNQTIDNNQIINSDFSSGMDNWDLEDVYSLTSTTENGLIINIIDAGDHLENTQLKQSGLQVIEDVTYEISFVVYAAENRTIGVALQESESPFNSFTHIEDFEITNKPARYSFTFTMEETSDYNAQIVFSMGGDEINLAFKDIYFGQSINNIKPCIDIDTSLHVGNSVTVSNELSAEFYPNPVKSVGNLEIRGVNNAVVSYIIYDFMGKTVQHKSDINIFEKGLNIPIDYSSFANGIYFIRINVQDNSGKEIMKSTLKIIKE